MVHRSSRRGRRGRRELLIMRLRPALVWFLLLSLTRMAESDDCEGKIGHVKFCDAGKTLKLDSDATSTTQVGWTFEGQSGSIPSRATYDPAAEKQKLTLENLSAADSGKYTATYSDSTTKTFSILVGAVTCDAGAECKVVTGSSIKMDSAAGSAIDVSWTHTKPDAPETAIDEANKFTDDKKKEMGRFNMQLADAGTYKAKYPNPSPTTTATFTVSVQAPITAVKIAGKVSACAGKSVILECKVTGDAKVVTWKKGTTPQATNVSGKKLTISEAKPEDAGEYTCNAESYPGGNPVESAGFTLTVSAAVDCDEQQNNVIPSIIENNEKEGTLGGYAAQAASCSVALLLMTSLLQLCWML